MIRVTSCSATLSPRLAQETEGQEPVPVPYRFSVTAARNGKCNVFRPNTLNPDAASSARQFGAARHGLSISTSEVQGLKNMRESLCYVI